MTQRTGSAKRDVILSVGAIIVLLGVLAAGWYMMREHQRQSDEELAKTWRKLQDEMREGQVKTDKIAIAALKKGGAYVSGARFSAGGGSSFNIPAAAKGDETTCTIGWSVPPEDFAKITEGITLEQVRGILDLSALHYIPDGPQSRFVLRCKSVDRKVTLVFAGDPDVKLVKKSAEGAG